MIDYNELISFIENSPPEDKWFDDTRWANELGRLDSAWRDFVRASFENADAWERIEDARPRNSYSGLCIVLMDAIGLPLVEHWINSSNDKQQKEAKEKSCALLARWRDFHSATKDAVLLHLFDKKNSAAERHCRDVARCYSSIEQVLLENSHSALRPEARLRELTRIVGRLEPGPRPGYVAPCEIERLLDITETAGDIEYMDRNPTSYPRAEASLREDAGFRWAEASGHADKDSVQSQCEREGTSRAVDEDSRGQWLSSGHTTANPDLVRSSRRSFFCTLSLRRTTMLQIE